ncbi:GGDEF domain-containing protein [Thalassotalea sp. PLHSN55]|uniref:GGDEF domain-containing protein n=1 Tax=Thalassotalea sp. PLHSN55 TaxID=3435888 RepID=UPI003F852B1C
MPNKLISPEQTEFQLKSTLWLFTAAGSLILPFALYDISQGKWQIGLGALIIAFALFLGSWCCYKKTYKPIYTFLLLSPFSTFFLLYLTNTVGISGTYWCYPTILLFYFVISERQAWISNIVLIVCILPLAWNLLEANEAARFTVTLILVSAYAAIFLRVITQLYDARCRQANTDPLTRLYNRASLQDSLTQAIHQADRTGTAFTLIGMDIDFFKQINDELGHDVGDNVLVQLGAFLKGYFRESDKVFRTGGEEFLILICNSNEAESAEIAEKMRKDIENLSIIPDRTVTVSIGVSGIGVEKDWQVWMKTCDQNLYKAKHNGRNRVVVGSV